MTSTEIKNTKAASSLRKRNSEQSGTDTHKATGKKKTGFRRQIKNKEFRIIPTERSEQSF